MKLLSYFSSLSFLFLFASCIQTQAPVNSSSNNSGAGTVGSNSPTKFFMNNNPRYYNLIARREVDFKGFLDEYPDYEHVTIKSVAGSSRYSREELEKSNYIVSEYLPGPNGTYLMLVEELNGSKLSQFTIEL